LQAIADIFTGAVDLVAGAFGAIWEAVSAVIGGWITDIKETINAFIGWIAEAAKKIANTIKGGIGAVQSRVGGAAAAAAAARGSSRSVEDAIISPNGDIISTHPKDYLIATKNPSELIGAGAGAGGGITINMTGTFLDQKSAEKIGNLIIQKLRKNINPG